MTEVITQYDAVSVNEIPTNAVAVAGYVGGLWPTESILVQKFPHARHKSIAVNAGEDAEILDIENGDAVPADAPGWFHRQKARGLALPGFYASASVIGEVIAVLKAAGIARDEYVIWVAHYTGVRPAPPFEEGADAVQYSDQALGRNLDISAATLSFWSDKPAPPVKNTIDYSWFDSTPRRIYLRKRTERGQVELYDKLRALQTPTKHPHRLQLWFVKKVLNAFAKRVKDVAEYRPNRHTNKPSWGVDHRGWRYQQLIHRAAGQRFV